MTRLFLSTAALLAIACTLSTADPADAQKPRAAKRPTSRTFQMALFFDRKALDDTLFLISATIGVPIEIVGPDLQLQGVTKNQSFALNEPQQPVEQLLRTILLKANPDDKLAYTVKPNAQGIDTVYIVSREGAAKRGETLFPEFKVK